jgi:hypothetical protein
MMTTTTVLDMLRETARMLNKPQAVVATNWLRSGLMKPYDAEFNVGISQAEYEQALLIVVRLANTVA